MRACASRKRAQGGSTIAVSGRSLRGVTAGRLPRRQRQGRRREREGARRRATRRCGSRCRYGAVSGSVALVSGERQLQALGVRADPARAAARAERRALTGARPARRGRAGVETGTSRTKAYIGARRAVTFSYRLTTAAPTVTVELVKALDGSVVKSWTPARPRPARSRASPGTARSAGRRRARAATRSGSPPPGQRRRRAQRPGQRRRARRLRPLRQRLPDPRQARLRRRRRPLRRRPRRPQPPGPGRVRQVRHARWSRRAGARSSSPATRAWPATTS